jgi:hypothetical protein
MALLVVVERPAVAVVHRTPLLQLAVEAELVH